MKLLTFERLVGLSSLFIASCAAFFSIIGIGMLFSGSSIAAMTMACSLELGKLVATSFLYRYWNKTQTFLKTYLTVSVVVLMIITSLGIFGYLSSAYQQSSIQNQVVEQKIQLLVDQKQHIQENIISSKTRMANITQLRNSQESRLSQSMTNILIARNPIQLRQIQQQTQDLIDQAEKDFESENVKIQKAGDQLQTLDQQIINLKLESGSKKDIQTFKFVADEFGVNINKVVKWFIVALISVFDPLAVCLLLAYNTAIAQNKSEKIETPKQPIVQAVVPTPIIPESGSLFITSSADINNTSSSDHNTEPTENNIIESVPVVPQIQTTQPAAKIYPYSF